MSKEYKKFGEITRDEQLELINHVLDGGEVEIFSNTSWHNTEMGKSGVVCFYNDYCYRKLKSELELLKEQLDELDEKIKKLGGIHFGDFVKKRGSTLQGKVYRVFESSLYENFPYKVDESFYSEDQVNHQFIKVK